MSDLLKVMAIGRLGKDPEMHYANGGTIVASFSIACSEKWKDKNGEKQESTEWVNCTAFGKLAEIIQQYVSKGSQVFIEGKLRTEKWQDKEGNDRYTTKVIVNNLQMLGSRDGSQSANNGTAQQANNEPVDDGFSDSIPF